ncbi:protein ACCELERATED CELL DEATH 6-like [Mangifera indica]|uniref:protein ACCELERATED CELL DEATH 6-like n=1 Tax=Mangifera indica TaxID=29780 RepID=UPI001CFB1C3F|nr:protein ACCELERATED CELL DEATH 6-like [Mangifera indica]
MGPSLYMAAREGNLDLPRRFIQGENHSNLQDLHTNQGRYIIHIAAKLGKELFIHEALQAWPRLASQENSKGDTPLHVAARAGQVAVVKRLIGDSTSRSLFQVDSIETSCLREMEEGASGVSVLWGMRNKAQSLALHEALRNRHEEAALCLWELDNEMAGVVTSAGESPLYLAAESRCEVMLRRILTFLKLNSERVELLRDAVQGPDGQNPLHAAVLAGSTENGHLTCILFLYSRVIDCIGSLLEEEDILKLINQPDINGKTALHFATAAREKNIMRELLTKSTSSAYLQDSNGRTPLLEAACSGNFDVLQEILLYCPDTIELADPTGKNALHLAVLNNTTNNVREFLRLPEMKELVNEPDEEGDTPLHLAIKHENYKMVKQLIATGFVDLRTKNNKGLTALDICESDWNFSYRQNSLHTYLKGLNAPRGRQPYNYWKQDQKSKTALNHPNADLKNLAKIMSVVAALLVTVTFAAAFTLPGGYHGDDDDRPPEINHSSKKDKIPSGTSILIKNPSLKVFVFADSLAMCSSMTVLFLLIQAMAGDPAFLRSAIIYSEKLLNIALHGALVAFVTGLYAVISPESTWLAISIIIMGSSVPFLIKLLQRKSSTSTPPCDKSFQGNNNQLSHTELAKGVQILVPATIKPDRPTGSS